MGALAVLAMVDRVVPNEGQPLHPFFQANRSVANTGNTDTLDAHLKPSDTPEASISSLDNAEDDVALEGDAKLDGRRKKRRKLDVSADGQKQRSGARKRGKAAKGANITAHFAKLGQDQDLPPTPEPHPESDHTNDEQTNQPKDELPPEPKDHDAPLPASQPPPASMGPDKPAPLMLFDPKTGRIGPPPKSKTQPVPTMGGHVARDTGACSQTEKRKASSRLVRVKYGLDEESRVRFGREIDAIMAAGNPSTLRSKDVERPGDAAELSLKSDKKTHPFFLGNPKRSRESPAPSTAKAEANPGVSVLSLSAKLFSSTPCSPKKGRPPSGKTQVPQFGLRNMGLKVPGSKLPAWPCKDMVHVRGDDSLADSPCRSWDSAYPFPCRKSKGRAVVISAPESVMRRAVDAIDIPAVVEAIRRANTDDFSPPPREIRLPQKHFESGTKLQRRVLPELRRVGRGREAAHQIGPLEQPPQLARLFNLIKEELPAVDRSTCETMNWAQKYAPTSAAEVLQQGQEAFLLRDWLQALMVQSVDTGSGDGEKDKGHQPKSKASRKKRRKKLDGFVVSSDEEADNMDELSETDGDWVPSCGSASGVSRRTVIRAGDMKAKSSKDPSRLTNAIVLSGPHGCGKTAAVYAVAGELGFEVFEINPGSRRSGKDVLERIGDMTRNHLVSHQQEPAGSDAEEVAAALDEGVIEDIKSGKQSTMGSFFKPNTNAKLKKEAKKETKKEITRTSLPEKKQERRKDRPLKQHKQSLILLDEADVLYEEDKQFWTTVMGLMAQSKRPFVMTCTDEALLPLQSLVLHGILRLDQPPADFAVDRLILIAANEGHALQRDAVEALYEARNRDLRAATMDLNYWCQIGVGDRRGGFDWFYLRWPKGVDLDEDNEVVRVVSEGTYQLGMNWLVRDHVVQHEDSNSMEAEDELLQEARRSSNLDIGQCQSSAGLLPWAGNLGTATSDPGSRVALLGAFDDFSEAMSWSDLYSSGSLVEFQEEPIDATLPDISDKARDDYISGLELLDTPPAFHYDSFLTSLPSIMRSKARAVLRSSTQRIAKQLAHELGPFGERKLVDSIRHDFGSHTALASTSRLDFSLAFDPIAVLDSTQSAPSHLEPSVLDRTMKLLVLDVAPYIRGIVAYDSHLQKQRLKLSNLVSKGGRGGGTKRMRTTRAAYSALEGGSRSTTRPERWFKADLNPYLVSRTGGEGWEQLSIGHPVGSGSTSPTEETGKKSARPAKRNVVSSSSDDELSFS